MKAPKPKKRRIVKTRPSDDEVAAAEDYLNRKEAARLKSIADKDEKIKELEGKIDWLTTTLHASEVRRVRNMENKRDRAKHEALVLGAHALIHTITDLMEILGKHEESGDQDEDC